MEAFAELLRRTTSAENAAQMIETGPTSMSSTSPRRLDVPTLILHARGDLRVPFEGGLELGTLIRGSRVIPLDSANHLLRADEPAWARLLAEIDAFLAADGVPTPLLREGGLDGQRGSGFGPVAVTSR